MAKLQAYPEWHAALVPTEGQTKEKDTDKERAKEKDKAEAPPKAAEKTESTWSWPFGKKK
jgi:hypothetical protein